MAGKIHYPATFVAWVVQYALGAVWYGALSSPWMAAHGLTPENMGSSVALPYILSALAGLIFTFTMAGLRVPLNADNLWKGINFGLAAGFGLMAMTTVIHFAYIEKPLAAFLIDGGYDVIRGLSVGVILAVWRKK